MNLVNLLLPIGFVCIVPYCARQWVSPSAGDTSRMKTARMGPPFYQPVQGTAQRVPSGQAARVDVRTQPKTKKHGCGLPLHTAIPRACVTSKPGKHIFRVPAAWL